MEDEATITLLTEDNQRFEVSRKAATQIRILGPMLSLPGATVVPVPTVKGLILDKVVQFVRQHQEDLCERPAEADHAPSNDLYEDNIDQEESTEYFEEEVNDEGALFANYVASTTPWDQKFLDALDLPTLVELTKAANFLNVPSLLDLCCRTIAKQMTGLKAPELRRKFNLPNDFTPEEEARMAAEFAWIG